ncbi:rhomboid family intramembrane serine protease [Pedobacter alpinus]|uniref:Rhomboid family intramembrane serine protease n=1 Tax=Pedobacter alpinus TaxID=1590643 RepID=A0ABW5TY80_9SPHI
MAILYFFGIEIEVFFNIKMGMPICMIMIFFFGVGSASIANLILRKSNLEFSLLGASNGVFAILGVSLILFANQPIKFFPIPFSNTAIIFGLILLMLFNHQTKKDNIDYFGHLTSFISGLLIALIIR